MDSLSSKQPKRRTARDGKALLKANLISSEKVVEVEQTRNNFSMAVTPEMMNLIDPNDPNDPIARQFIPTKAELQVSPEEYADPIADDPFSPVKGITHRYPDRLLLKPVHVCPVYCRFCLRREKVGSDGEALSAAELSVALDYVSAHEEVWEVILTGGDPLILPAVRLAHLICELDRIPHVSVIRIHTRVPVVDPNRINTEMLKALKVKTPVYVVLHTNHPRELTAEAEVACASLVDSGIPMLSQSALLKGVNDDPEVMSQLMKTLVRNRIKPYYLHHGDLAEGTGHFRTSIEEGQEIVRRLRGRISGMCQPTYVLDIPGGYGKVPIGPQYLHNAEDAENSYLVEDPWLQAHKYPPKPGTANREQHRSRPWT